jgi:DNA-3-methyladenine glycosylase II
MNRDLTFRLRPVAPFRLALTAWALRRRPDNRMDRWDGEAYRRILVLDGRPASLEVRQKGTLDRPLLDIKVADADREMKKAVTVSLERLLGLRRDLSGFYRFAKRHPELKPLAKTFRGLKPPRFPTIYEALVNGIACQQLTLTVGILLLNRLTERFGLKCGSEAAFPRPEDLATVKAEALRKLGFSHHKAMAVVEISRRVASGDVNLEELDRLDDEALLRQLDALHGVGRWTAEYVLLRGFGRLSSFPGDDVGARNRLQKMLHLPARLDYVGVRRITDAWSPYGGLIYFHLLLNGLAEKGVLHHGGSAT